MAHMTEDGDVTPYEPASPAGYLQGDEISKEFIAFVKERNPKLVPLAEPLIQECSRSEAAKELGLPTSTVGSRAKKLEELVREFCAD